MSGRQAHFSHSRKANIRVCQIEMNEIAIQSHHLRDKPPPRKDTGYRNGESRHHSEGIFVILNMALQLLDVSIVSVPEFTQ